MPPLSKPAAGCSELSEAKSLLLLKAEGMIQAGEDRKASSDPMEY
ncbi:hypothetical protein NBRC3257_0268 [Gluconobacter thailandicus NBRC 3257]|uniref:Transposase n=1 Tax=Gluconobacter thailandicus NBRC 3257 TaxID=1381097 RepID=A0ABQ0ISS5_GLUTH|nr:hypothetical protein NBRC3255_2676 [Gluconobacter thailandicus NBRC 3255]GAD25269.1 hypothetical protein NBRC3257_0268 [Gluconobacter thailandicus NBRC 3257]